jgi:hypothetical protein
VAVALGTPKIPKSDRTPLSVELELRYVTVRFQVFAGPAAARVKSTQNVSVVPPHTTAARAEAIGARPTRPATMAAFMIRLTI